MWGCSTLGLIKEKQGYLSEAERLHKKGCDHKDMMSCYSLGLLLEKKGNHIESEALYK